MSLSVIRLYYCLISILPKASRTHSFKNPIQFCWITALFLLANFCANTLLGKEPIREWTNSDGRSIKARYIEQTEKGVKIERIDGRSFTLPLIKFSKNDQEYVLKLLEKDIFRTPEPFADNYKGVIIVAGLSGEVKIAERPEGNRYAEYVSRHAKVGDMVQNGTVLTTGKDSEAQLIFTNGTLANLRENSRLSLSAFWQVEFDGSDRMVSELKNEVSASRIALELKLGELVMDVRKLEKDSSLMIETMLGQAGVRGTQFRILMDEESTSLGVHEGEVAFLDKKNEIKTVSEGENLGINKTGESDFLDLSKGQRLRIQEAIERCSKESNRYSTAQLGSVADQANKKGVQNIINDGGALQKQIDELIKEYGSIRKIEEINIDHTKVSDLSDLNQLLNLKSLQIEGDYRKTILTKLPRFDQLQKLENLKITAAFKLKEMQSIGDLTSLSSLFIGWTSVENSEFLKKLTKLENLSINYWKTKNLDHIQNCKKLVTLKLSAASELSDISALSGLKELTTLEMTQTKIEDIKPIKNLRKLKRLVLKSAQSIKDYSPLLGMKQLESLNLENTGITEKDQKRLVTILRNCKITF